MSTTTDTSTKCRQNTLLILRLTDEHAKGLSLMSVTASPYSGQLSFGTNEDAAHFAVRIGAVPDDEQNAESIKRDEAHRWWVTPDGRVRVVGWAS